MTILTALSASHQGPLTPPNPPPGWQEVENRAVWGWRLQIWRLPAGDHEAWIGSLATEASAEGRILERADVEKGPGLRLVLQGEAEAETLRMALAVLHLEDLAPLCILRAEENLLELGLGGAADWRDATRRLADALDGLPVDSAVCPLWTSDHFGLLLTDMDSTLISIECIDELADLMGRKAEVAAVTERAMQGELDFAASLRARVQLLAGAPERILEQVYRERLRLNPGARELIRTLQGRGLKIGLVSGGFTYFTDRIKTELGLDYAFGNVLEIRDGAFTGQVLGEILGAQGKARILQELADGLDLPLERCIAMGDGANDLPMLRAAGLGIAYHAKPVVRAQADFGIRHGGLDTLLPILGL